VLLSTLDERAAPLAQRHGLGVELAEFCDAQNMDSDFARWDRRARESLRGAFPTALHAPFAELCPAAVDPLIADVARKRFGQAFVLSELYGIEKLIAHTGFVPILYDPAWFVERSVAFWKGFLSSAPPDVTLLLENVFEPAPELLVEIARGVDDARLRLCLDTGHTNVSGARTPIEGWIDAFAPWLEHVHLHNNFGDSDAHNAPGEGTIDADAAVRRIRAANGAATFTLECRDCEAALTWWEGHRELFV